MRQTNSEEPYPLDAKNSTEHAAVTRRYLVPVLITVAGVVVFSLVYRHLTREAMSQGFVLQELAPFMNLLIDWGKRLYWFGGRPLFPPTLVALAGLLVIAGHTLSKRRFEALGSSRGPVVLAVCFSLMYLIGGTRSFPLYVAGMAAVPLIGWAGEYKAGSATDQAGAISRKEKALLAAILLAGLLLRIYEVDVFPRLYSVDEQLLAQVTLDLGRQPLQFFAEPHIMKPHLLRIAAMRLAFSLLGVGLFQDRTVSVLEGTFTILLAYWLCRRLWGNRAGLFAAFLLAVDPWHIGQSRVGVHNIEGPLFLLLLLLLIFRAVRRGGTRNFALLGAAAGATIYLYLSCLIMAPFAWTSAILGRHFSAKAGKKTLLRETAVMIAASILIALPYFTLGRKNIGELENFYSTEGHFLAAAREHGWNPAFTAFVNFWNGIEYMVNWSARLQHPAKSFYPNPIAIGLALIGLGMLFKMRKKFEHAVILVWIPLAFVPETLSYGFAERRLFATLAPIPALLGGLLLAKLWERASEGGETLVRRLYRLQIAALLILLALVSTFIVYEDADPLSGGCPHPRKVAEFIGSLPPEYTVLISNQVKQNPFLVYLASYNRLKNADDKKAFSFVSVETLEATAEKIALTPHVAVVTDTGPREHRLIEKIRRLNPAVEVIESDQFLACLVHAPPEK